MYLEFKYSFEFESGGWEFGKICLSILWFWVNCFLFNVYIGMRMVVVFGNFIYCSFCFVMLYVSYSDNMYDKIKEENWF